MMQLEAKFLRALHTHRNGRNAIHARLDNAHEFYQSSILNAILGGVYDGDLTFGELAKHGDFGLGTFNSLDGEMVGLDGKFYQIKSSGEVSLATPKMKTPYALVTFFKPEIRFSIKDAISEDKFEQYFDKALPSKNFFYALKIKGNFKSIKARSVPKQQKPYRPLIEVAKEQSIFNFEYIQGTIVGFRFPDYSTGISVPGYHLHFLSEDGLKGGHVLNCSMEGIDVEIDHTVNFHLEMPQHGSVLNSDFSKTDAESIRKIEH
jgi:acetolactate decarboxylase